MDRGFRQWVMLVGPRAKPPTIITNAAQERVNQRCLYWQAIFTKSNARYRYELVTQNTVLHEANICALGISTFPMVITTVEHFTVNPLTSFFNKLTINELNFLKYCINWLTL
jgi:hypothetical protein